MDKNLIKTNLNTLIESCNEGMTGEWDAGSIEGRESFAPMIELLNQIKKELDNG
jgi:hypothetical protein